MLALPQRRWPARAAAMIPIYCPHCQHQNTVADYLAGQSVLCDECGEVFAAQEEAPRPPWLHTIPDRRATKRGVPAKYLSGTTLIWCGALIALVGGLCFQLPALAAVLLLIGSILLQIGIIRIAIAPLQDQNEELLRALRERKDDR
jgi:hypothetical protein